MHSLEYVQEHTITSKGRARAVRYTPLALDEQVYMHPQSALAKAAPEFVAYTQIVRTAKRPYMTGKSRSERAHLLYFCLSMLGMRVRPQESRSMGSDTESCPKDVTCL